MKRKLFLPLLLCCTLLLGITGFAAEPDHPEPTEPVTVSDSNYAEAVVYFSTNQAARLYMGMGSVTIKSEGGLIAIATGYTNATQVRPLVKLTLDLYHYYPASNTSSFVDSASFSATNSAGCSGARNFPVATAGYYYVFGLHQVGSEMKTSQTDAIFVKK